MSDLTRRPSGTAVSSKEGANGWDAQTRRDGYLGFGLPAVVCPRNLEAVIIDGCVQAISRCCIPKYLYEHL